MPIQEWMSALHGAPPRALVKKRRAVDTTLTNACRENVATCDCREKRYFASDVMGTLLPATENCFGRTTSAPNAVESYQKYRTDMGNTINAILNENQQQQWRQMTGEPFRFSLPSNGSTSNKSGTNGTR